MPILISCEHATNRIPVAYQHLFRGKQRVLDSHRGWDVGAKELAQLLSQQLETPLVKGNVSRLLIDLNRSPGNRQLFSSYSKSLDALTRKEIVARYFQPYRDRVEQLVTQMSDNNNLIVHLSIHSFTPVLHGHTRNADLGFLYDPSRQHEKTLARQLGKTLAGRFPALKVRYNYPYRGTADGMTSYLRKRFPASRYAGIEIELNQKHVLSGSPVWHFLKTGLAPGIVSVLNNIH